MRATSPSLFCICWRRSPDLKSAVERARFHGLRRRELTALGLRPWLPARRVTSHTRHTQWSSALERFNAALTNFLRLVA